MHDSNEDLLAAVEEHAATVGPYGGAEFAWLLVFTAVIPAVMLVVAYGVM